MNGGGRETPLVLLHGWGMGPSVFDVWCRELPGGREVRRPDLARCGSRVDPGVQADPLAALAAIAAAGLDRPAHWVGWSLGGLVALKAALQVPALVRRVTLLASSPRMVAASDWPGIDAAELARFRRELWTDAGATHDRFLTLQVRGGRDARAALRALRRAVSVDGLPPMDVLATGLDLLLRSDLRSDLDALSCPVHAVLGERDALVPAAVAPRLERLCVPTRIVPGAGHVPFISHPGVVTDAIME